MTDMLSMISAEPVATVVAERPAAQANPDKSFEQVLQESAGPAEQTVEAEQSSDVALDAEDLVLEEVQLDDIASVEPQAVVAEPVVTFSVGHVALQASMEEVAPTQTMPEQPALPEVTTDLPVEQIAVQPVRPDALPLETNAETEPEPEVAVEEASDLAPYLTAEPADVSPNVQAEKPARPVMPEQQQPVVQDVDTVPLAKSDALAVSELAEDSQNPQAPKLEAKVAPVSASDVMAAPNLQLDDPQALPPLTQVQAKEPATFDKLLAAAPVVAPTAEDKSPASPLVRNILDRMQELEISEGKTRILLRPQGMGALEIDILRQIDGRIHLAIRVENPMVLEALRNESGALSSFMGEKGFDLSNGGPDLSSYHRPTQGEDDISSDDGDTEPTQIETALLDGKRLNILT